MSESRLHPDVESSTFWEEFNNWVRPLWRRRRLFALTFLLSILSFLGAIVLWPRAYESSGTVIIGNFEPAKSSASAWAQKLGDPADVESQLLIAKSNRMLRLTLVRPGVLQAIQEECRHGLGLSLLTYLLGPPRCEKLQPGSDELLAFVAPRFSVTAQPRSRVISIGFRSHLPEVSFILANALLVTYLEDQRAENGSAREFAAKWVLELAVKLNHGMVGQPGTPAQTEHSFYEDLHKKAKDFETERRSLPNPSRLVSLAEFPNTPVSPRVMRLLGLGLAVAAALAGFVAFQKDRADKSVRLTSDLETLTGKPVLASLPLAPAPRRARALAISQRASQKRVSVSSAVASNWESKTIAEAARALHARILLSISRKTGRCILVSSGAPGEGKTYTTMALARAAAESGRRVLVINCDFRAFRVPAGQEAGAAGLAGVLRADLQPHEAVVQTPVEGLDIIPAGLADRDPAMLLIDGQLAKLMAWAEHYQLVLLDGPSGFPPDVRILAEYADGVLWCVRWGQTLLPDVKTALEELRSQGINLLGLALTMVDLIKMRDYEHPAQPSQRF